MPPAKKAALWPSNSIIALSALEVVFLVTTLGVTATLDQDTQCYLNPSTQKSPPGSACDFTYVCCGFGLLFSLTLLGTTAYAQKVHAGKKPVIVWAAIHLALFAGLWWIPLVVTLTVQGSQANDETSVQFPTGLPYYTERTSVTALNYIILIFYYTQAALGIADRWINSRSRFGSEAEEQFIPEPAEGFAHTRALSETPVN